MTPFTKLVTSSLIFVSLFGGTRNLLAQEGRPAEPLSIEEVVQLHNAGFSDDVIVTRIKKNAKAFSLNTQELLELKKAGLSDTIMRFLLDPAQPYSPVPPPPPAAPASSAAGSQPPARPARQFPADENAAKIPPDPGLYRVEGDNVIRIDLKLLLAVKAGGGLGKLLSKSKAYLAGPTAKTRTEDPGPVFYLRLAEGKAIEEIVLVALDRKGERRELETGAAAPKQELKSDVIRQFDSVEVAPLLFRVTASKLASGEYFFFQIGTSDAAKGSSGKGFDFGVDEAKPAAKK